MKKKLVCLVLTIFFTFNLINPVVLADSQIQTHTQSYSENQVQTQVTSDVEVYAEACSLIDIDSGKVLYEKNSNQVMYPASTTKLMTAIIVLEKCPDLSQIVNISYYSVHSVPYTYSVASIQPGEKFSIKELLTALMVASANDAAYSLAEYVVNNGNNFSIDNSADTKNKFQESISKFSELMNEKAKELGCTNTNFVNPNGVHNENHYSTAYDLSLIGKYAYKSVSCCNAEF